MPTMRSRSLFISHSWSYGSAYKGLVALLDTARHFRYHNYCVPKNDPVHNAPTIEALSIAIKGQMLFCNVALLLAGQDATHSEWIQREIRIAKEDYRKPIVAVRRWSHERVSPVVSLAADRLVGWNTESIVSAIREVDP